MDRYQKRKHPRLKYYDYSLPGYYHVTIHAAPAAPAFSSVKCEVDTGEANVTLTAVGKITQQQLLELEQRYNCVKIDKYVIMPNHIHAIVRLTEVTAGASPRPTLMDLVGAYKSLTTRTCNQYFGTPGRKLFQTSFYETVLRNEKAYQECWCYIENNPGKWIEGECE